jgi:hypothetical protein
VKNFAPRGAKFFRPSNAVCPASKELSKKQRLLIDIKHISDKVATARCSEKNPPKLLVIVVRGKIRGLRLRELDIQAATTFPASSFALNAQSQNEILLGGFPPSKFTEQDFRSILVSGRGAAYSAIRIARGNWGHQMRSVIEGALWNGAVMALVLLPCSMLEE